jgi:hypothetical protein
MARPYAHTACRLLLRFNNTADTPLAANKRNVIQAAYRRPGDSVYLTQLSGDRALHVLLQNKKRAEILAS